MRTLTPFLFLSLAMAATGTARAVGAYTNLAGTVISGTPLAITPRTVTLTNGAERLVYRLAIFPEGEKRRLAAELGSTQFVPRSILLALDGVRKAMRRSRKRAEAGTVPKERSDAFCARESENIRRYLEHEVAEGRLMPIERDLLSLFPERLVSRSLEQ